QGAPGKNGDGLEEGQRGHAQHARDLWCGLIGPKALGRGLKTLNVKFAAGFEVTGVCPLDGGRFQRQPPPPIFPVLVCESPPIAPGPAPGVLLRRAAHRPPSLVRVTSNEPRPFNRASFLCSRSNCFLNSSKSASVSCASISFHSSVSELWVTSF